MSERVEITKEQLFSLMFIAGESIMDTLKTDYLVTLRPICKHGVERPKCSVCGKSHAVKLWGEDFPEHNMRGRITNIISPERIIVTFYQGFDNEYSIEDLYFWAIVVI